MSDTQFIRTERRRSLRGPHRAAARAMLKAVGFADEALKKPLIGVANTWIEIGPCNYHLRELAAHVKEGIRAAGGTPMEFNTVSISDGITMGTEGMRASLVSREVIADSIELVARGNSFDARRRALSAATRRFPARRWRSRGSTSRASCSTAARSRPGTFAGPRRHDPGRLRGGRRARGRPHDRRRARRRSRTHACPGAGACGGQFTANTMATVLRVPRHLADGQRRACRPPTRRRPTSAAPAGALVVDAAAAGPPAARRSSRATAFENAIAVGRRHRRLDQRRAAPAGDRARGRRRRSSIDDFDRDQRARAAARRPEAGRPLRRHRPATRPAARALVAKRLLEAGAAARRRDRR